jgi:hypothetical protein
MTTLELKLNDLFYRDETGKFPDYPSDEEGGSAVIFHPELHADLVSMS